ncbi:unnamed protein product [Nezara viridula]|uniref:Uncharacterized protein n=1 Tax=Nezara viridula TaxID=85310 RepID=A0A9P0MUN0_NEZVI|nr:unnamed protein product [Nezara viridula]
MDCSELHDPPILTSVPLYHGILIDQFL